MPLVWEPAGNCPGYMNYYGFLDNAVYPPAGVDREQIIPFELEA